jgi:hypothetical protein
MKPYAREEVRDMKKWLKKVWVNGQEHIILMKKVS